MLFLRKRYPNEVKIPITIKIDRKIFVIAYLKYLFKNILLFFTAILFLKLEIFSWSSGFVTNVTIIQKIVVVKTIIGYFMYGSKKPFSPKKLLEMKFVFNNIEKKPEKNIAEISLHALILYQNHLKINIKPVPAPNIKIKLNNCNALVRNNAIIEEKTNKSMVIILADKTNLFSSEITFFKTSLTK